jgi:RimJ/RimL family protein N-acetyltransferase
MREPVVLQTGRVVLRPYRIDDVDGVLAYASDERWSRFLLPIQREYTRADAEEWVTASMAIDWDEHPRWAIEHEGPSPAASTSASARPRRASWATRCAPICGAEA